MPPAYQANPGLQTSLKPVHHTWHGSEPVHKSDTTNTYTTSRQGEKTLHPFVHIGKLQCSGSGVNPALDWTSSSELSGRPCRSKIHFGEGLHCWPIGSHQNSQLPHCLPGGSPGLCDNTPPGGMYLKRGCGWVRCVSSKTGLRTSGPLICHHEPPTRAQLLQAPWRNIMATFIASHHRHRPYPLQTGKDTSSSRPDVRPSLGKDCPPQVKGQCRKGHDGRTTSARQGRKKYCESMIGQCDQHWNCQWPIMVSTSRFFLTSWYFLLTFILLFQGGCDAANVITKPKTEIQMINGFVLLGFEPAILEVRLEHTITGSINVSLLETSPPIHVSGWVWPCCPDPRVASLSSPEPVDVPTNSNLTSLLLTSVQGRGLGRTSIRFLLVSNSTSKQIQNTSLLQAGEGSKGPLPTPSKLLARSPFIRGPVPGDMKSVTFNMTGATWWLPYDYEIKVINEEDPACFYLSGLVFGLIVINLIGIGGQIDGEMMIYLLKKPSAVSICLLCRFGIIPAVSRSTSIYYSIPGIHYGKSRKGI